LNRITRGVCKATLALLAAASIAHAEPPAAGQPDGAGFDALIQQGDAMIAQKQDDQAYGLYTQALKLKLQAAAEDPENPDVRHAINLALLDLAAILQRQGDVGGAINDDRAVAGLSTHMLKAHPDNAPLQRDVGIALLDLARAPGGNVGWDKVRAHWQAMAQNQTLQPQDRPYLDAALAGPAGGPAHGGKAKSNKGLRNPDWIRPPSPEQLDAIFAAAPRAMSGSVELRCRVRLDTSVTDCSVMREPAGQTQLGAAMLQLSKTFRLTPMTLDGAPTDFGVVYIPLSLAVR
jgi:hypothetical protein